MTPCRRALGALVALAFLSSPAWAQWRIGQTTALTGPAAASAREVTQGARLVLDAVNRRGGVHGQSIELVTLDDRYEPDAAAANARQLIDQGVLALFLTRGTPTTQAILPLLGPARIPLIAPSTGAKIFHRPVQPWVFNVRASYQREAEKGIRHMGMFGMTRIGLLQVDDSFGADGAEGALAGFKAIGREPLLNEKFSRDKPVIAPLVKKLVDLDAQGVMVVGTDTVVADVLKQLRAAGSRAQVITLSNNASSGFAHLLGPQGRGTIVTQVFPNERNANSPLVKDARALLGPGAELSPAMLEGVAAAKVLVEALRRAGPGITREKIRTALEGFQKVDIGGLEVSFSASDHSGVDFADLAILDEDGHFRR